nr:uncharacterized protein LOC107452148 [Parasteatoda tepidariorum]
MSSVVQSLLAGKMIGAGGGGLLRTSLYVGVKKLEETVPVGATLAKLNDLILASDEYKKDPEFVKQVFEDTVKERKIQEQEKEAMELEKARMAHELEMARLQAQDRESTIQNVANSSSINTEAVNTRRKFTLPKLGFRQFGDDVKEWLPFWSQFQHIDNDADIALEDKFQYLIQATVMGSRAREIVESFPPTGENYTKAVDSLKSRFGNEDLLVEIYVRELLKLIINVQVNRSFPLTSLYDKL